MQEEKTLLGLFKKGDQEAFDTLFKKYASKLYYFSLRFFNDKADAEEIVQETFIRIWEARDRINVDQHFNTYVITVAKHLIYNRFRHKLVERKYQEFILNNTGDSYSIERDIILKQLKEKLLDGIARLPSQQEKILMLKYQGYDNKEIARQLQLSKRTVEIHINKAFKSLRLFLEQKKTQVLALIVTMLQ